MESTREKDVRTLFLRYITGRLSIPEQEEIETRLLADHEFSDLMAVCEQELIDAYATGTCTTDELTQLRPWIEGSPTRMQRVAIAKSLLAKTRRDLKPQRAGIFALALAACLLLAAGLVINRSRSIKKPSMPADVSQSAPAAVPGQVATQPSGKPDVVLLIAERIRGRQEQIPTFSLHAGSPVNLEILLATDSGSHFDLKIVRESTSPKTVFEKSHLEPHLAAGQEYLSATLGPGSMPPGTYRVILTRTDDVQLMRFKIK